MDTSFRWNIVVCSIIFVVAPRTCSAADRVYYIACNEEIWDYAPGGGDSLKTNGYGEQSDASVFLDPGPDRIGHQYKKAIYREYTDAAYSTEKPKPDWLGFLGPVLKAEVGDSLLIHFKNNASRTYTMHPHGVVYTKSHEGALYADGVHKTDRARDLVPPGGSHVYNWTVADVSSPSEGDPDCITWLYHSHKAPSEDISTGLVGFLLTCRKGTLARWEGTRMFALYVSVVDENLSWYLDDNIATYTNSSVDKDGDDFQESNKMHAINGYVYGHLPGLSACVGETIHWHMASLGTEVDVHSLAVSGHSFEYFNHRTDSIRLTVAHFVTASMKALTIGNWLMQCQVNDHISAGMEATFTVDHCNEIDRYDFTALNTRRYYIGAEESMWNYAPSGRNNYDGGSLTEEGSDSEVFFKKDTSHIGGIYKKALFQEYTTDAFTMKMPRTPDEEHLGFLGPVIRAEVGDLVQIVFYNKASRPYSIHPHGIQFSKLSEGSLYNDNDTEKNDDYVQSNTMYTYNWTIPEEMGPAQFDPPCLTRMYTSGVDVIKDSYSGLIGPMLICRKGSLDEDGKQKDVNKEFFLMFSVSDENKSWYLKDNINISGVDSNIDTDGDEFVESNLMHGINGRLYGNLDGLNMCEGDKVMWHVFSVGTEVDLHTLTFNGDTFLNGENQKSTSDILPGNMKTLSMSPKHPGSWGLLCGTNDHYVAGTKAIYHVSTCSDTREEVTSLTGSVIRMYIQSTEIQWNYVPLNKNNIYDESFTAPDSPGAIFVGDSPIRIGGTYVKAVYQAYTDGTFTTPVIRPAEEKYLGFLGPVIKLQVDDVLEIVFKNNASRNYSIKAQGLFYDRGNDSFSSTTQPSVEPGNTFIYRWNLTESSGPGPSDPECITSVYFSDANPVKDVYTGLVGPLIVCRKGALKMSNGKAVRKNVEKDFVVYFSVIDENQSWYLQKNIEMFATDPAAVDTEDEDFVESNLMHAINGYLYGNQPSPKMTEGDTVDWYLITTGTEVDMHSVHFHGNDMVTFDRKKHTSDVAQLFPSIFVTVRMHAVNPGKWLYHCHVHDHIHAGMQGMYEVVKAKVSTTTPVTGKAGHSYMNFSIFIASFLFFNVFNI